MKLKPIIPLKPYLKTVTPSGFISVEKQELSACHKFVYRNAVARCNFRQLTNVL